MKTSEVTGPQPDVEIITENGSPFAVVIASIPEPEKTAFLAAQRGAQCPVVEGKGECAYLVDWMRFREKRVS